jgi:hypothetical protein
LRLLHLCSDSASFRVPPVFLVRPTGLRCQSELCAAARVTWVCVFFPLIDFAHRFPRRWSQNARLAPPRVFLTVDLARGCLDLFPPRRRCFIFSLPCLGSRSVRSRTTCRLSRAFLPTRFARRRAVRVTVSLGELAAAVRSPSPVLLLVCRP